MGCGCAGKKAKKRNASGVKKNIDYTPNGSNRTVRLGLKEVFRLPIRIVGVLDGQDVVIVENMKSVPPVEDAIIIIGRNAVVETRHKELLMQRWPKAFNA